MQAHVDPVEWEQGATGVVGTAPRADPRERSPPLPAWSGWRFSAPQPGFEAGSSPSLVRVVWSVVRALRSLLGYRRAAPHSGGSWCQARRDSPPLPPAQSGTGAGGGGSGRAGGGQTQRPRHAPARPCLLLPFQSRLSPPLPKALAWVPLPQSHLCAHSRPTCRRWGALPGGSSEPRGRADPGTVSHSPPRGCAPRSRRTLRAPCARPCGPPSGHLLAQQYLLGLSTSSWPRELTPQRRPSTAEGRSPRGQF